MWVFFVLNFEILVRSYLHLFLQYLTISGYLDNAVSATIVVFGVRFNKSFLWKKLWFFIWGQVAADPQKIYKRLVSQGVGFMNLLVLCEPKECFRWHINLIFQTFWCWMISVILQENQIVWEWPANQVTRQTHLQLVFYFFIKLAIKITYSRWICYHYTAWKHRKIDCWRNVSTNAKPASA